MIGRSCTSRGAQVRGVGTVIVYKVCAYGVTPVVTFFLPSAVHE
jgi:hypothetical protein